MCFLNRFGVKLASNPISSLGAFIGNFFSYMTFNIFFFSNLFVFQIKPKGNKDGSCKPTKQSSKGKKSSDKENNGTGNERETRKSSRLEVLAQKPNNKRDRQLLNDSSDLVSRSSYGFVITNFLMPFISLFSD